MPIEKWNLPPARVVSGHPSKAQVKTNFQTKQPIIKDGAQVMEYRCYLAWPKAEFMAHIWPRLDAEAKTVYPNGVGKDFSWKLIDGDSAECAKGTTVPYNKREGFPGHYLLKLSTEAFQPQIVKHEGGAYRNVTPEEFKTGYYAVANVDVKAHANNDGGLYINPNMYEFVAFGSEIVGQAADPNQLFGGQQYALPAGASAMPVSSAPAGTMPVSTPPGAPAAAPVATPPGYPAAPVTHAPAAPVAAPVATPPGYPAPAHDIVNNAVGAPAAAPVATPPGYPTAPVAPAAPVAPPAPVAVFPPAGWVAHPQSAGWYWNQATNEVISEADLRARGR